MSGKSIPSILYFVVTSKVDRCEPVINNNG